MARAHSSQGPRSPQDPTGLTALCLTHVLLVASALCGWIWKAVPSSIVSASWNRDILHSEPSPPRITSRASGPDAPRPASRSGTLRLRALPLGPWLQAVPYSFLVFSPFFLFLFSSFSFSLLFSCSFFCSPGLAPPVPSSPVTGTGRCFGEDQGVDMSQRIPGPELGVDPGFPRPHTLVRPRHRGSRKKGAQLSGWVLAQSCCSPRGSPWEGRWSHSALITHVTSL